MDDKSLIHDAKAEPSQPTPLALMHRGAIWSLVGACCIVAGYVAGMKMDDAGFTRRLLLWSDWLGFVIAPCLPMLLGSAIALLRGRYGGEAHWAGVGTIIGILSLPAGFLLSVCIANVFKAVAKPSWNLPSSADVSLLAFSVVLSAAALGASVGAIAADVWAAELQTEDECTVALKPTRNVGGTTDVV